MSFGVFVPGVGAQAADLRQLGVGLRLVLKLRLYLNPPEKYVKEWPNNYKRLRFCICWGGFPGRGRGCRMYG